jgi:two-component SAPR family response regulator
MCSKQSATLLDNLCTPTTFTNTQKVLTLDELMGEVNSGLEKCLEKLTEQVHGTTQKEKLVWLHVCEEEQGCVASVVSLWWLLLTCMM